MEWLQQNWINLLVLVGVILFLRFSGMGCGFGSRRIRPQHSLDRQPDSDTAVESASTTDPVSRRPVDPTSAVATVYQGRAYYFESRENRDRFEAAPDQYATVPKDEDQAARHRHHGGCC
ncbi:YHS domain-containing protein [Rhodoferax ferrireducens]|uniref:YHS domain-containing protein n=1 Tax=Rhodoferax ferrireducens TaxID=192843 RepID=UPI001300AD36|nr:YHS domain-containing protein [Rhodoferax ferrireducens]